MMPLRQLATLTALGLGTVVIAWYTWPRPDTLIRIRAGGVPVVTDRFGRDTPLPDTVFVGGSGGKRTIRVVNEDTRQHQVAMFNVPAGERTDYTVPLGTFGGACSAHPDNRQLTFVIR